MKASLALLALGFLLGSPALADIPPCFDELAASLNSKKFTEAELSCLNTEERFHTARNLFCSQDGMGLTVSYKRYLSYKRIWEEAREDVANSTTDAQRADSRLKASAIEAEWKRMGFKTEMELIALSLWTVRSRCERKLAQ